MTDHRLTPEVVAEAAWLHLVNRHDLAEALDELGGAADPNAISAVAAQLRNRRLAPATTNHGEAAR